MEKSPVFHKWGPSKISPCEEASKKEANSKGEGGGMGSKGLFPGALGFRAARAYGLLVRALTVNSSVVPALALEKWRAGSTGCVRGLLKL